MQCRITIVDDEGGIRIALQRFLNVAGLKTQGYASAEDFLDAPPGLRCDCLILDLGLPGMSGLELQNRLTGTHPRLPVIFVSAHDDPHIRAQAMQAGALAFFGKPFSEEGLLRLVQKAYCQTNSKYRAETMERSPSFVTLMIRMAAVVPNSATCSRLISCSYAAAVRDVTRPSVRRKL